MISSPQNVSHRNYDLCQWLSINIINNLKLTKKRGKKCPEYLSVLAAHNVRFDYALLKNEYRRIGALPQHKVLCTAFSSSKINFT